jgi:hypothetical protein
METPLIFILVLFLVAALYASVGHGGASGYLALMALFGMSAVMMKASALTLNLFVSAISFYAYYRQGYFRIRLLIPFVGGSIPMAFLGAQVAIDPGLYKVILGLFLVVAVARMLIQPKAKQHEVIHFQWVLAVVIGAFLGFFSGMIGIGGGIILSPVLLLLGWANVKETAAVSALFIFLNSTAGLAGLYSTGIQVNPEILFWIGAALSGGLLGAHMGAAKLSLTGLRYVLAIVLFMASIKLITPLFLHF